MSFWEVFKMTILSPLPPMLAVILVGFRKEIGSGGKRLLSRLKLSKRAAHFVGSSRKNVEQVSDIGVP